MKSSAGIRKAERVAVIDVGSNSVKLSIAVAGRRRPTVIETARIVTRLGEGPTVDGRLDRSAIDRTAEAVGQLADEARTQDAHAIRAVATSAAREATNVVRLIDAVKERSALELEVISGDREAELIFRAVAGHPLIEERTSLIFDTGGGSTELVRSGNGEIVSRSSSPLGALRLTRQFHADASVSKKTIAAIRRHVETEIRNTGFSRESPDVLVGTGGTCTALALLDIGPLPIVRHAKPPPMLRENHTMSRTSIEDLLDRLRRLDARERRETTGLGSRRAEILVAGICIVAELMTLFQTEWIALMDVGLRDGLLREMMD